MCSLQENAYIQQYLQCKLLTNVYQVQVNIDTYVHLLHVYLDYATIPTSEHALIHDTVPCQQHSITLHDTASSWYLDDVTRNEIIRVNLNKLCQQTSHNIT